MRRKVLAIALILALVPLARPAAGAPETEVAVAAPVLAHPGDTLTVNITVSPEVGLGGMECGIQFNASVLRAEAVEDAGLFDEWWNASLAIDNENGTVGWMLGFNYGGNATTSPGTFATVTFTATNQGRGWIRLVNVSLSDTTGTEAVPYTSDNDTVIVTVPPTADFVYSPPAPEAGESVSFNDNSSDQDGSIDAWEWQFGDGASSTQQNPGHIYSSGGTYEVTLTVTDDHGATNSTTQTVPVTANTPPHAPANPSPPDGTTGVSTSPTVSVAVSDPDDDTMDVTFYDASDDDIIGTASGVMSGGTASVQWSGLSYDTTYGWYAVADDGSATTESPDWSFTTRQDPSPPGPENERPNAAFSYSVSGHTVSFTDESSDPDGSIVARQWDFGDGSKGSSSGNQVQHSYDAPGRYIVTLTVTDEDGARDDAEEVVVINNPPVAGFEAPEEVVLGDIGVTVGFTDTSYDDTGRIVNWTWDFGDGTNGYDRNASHLYVEAGTYTVTLRVRDSYGASDNVSHTIMVQPTQPAYAFSVTDITCDVSLFGAGDVVVSIANAGEETAEGVSCTLFVDGDVATTKEISTLTANGTATLSFAVDLFPLRSHIIQAAVDPEDDFPEGNEDDNALSIEVPVNWLLIAVIAAAAIAAAIGIIYLVRRRRHQAAGEPRHREVTVQDGQQIQRCFVCRGKLKADAAAVQCTCGNIFHRSCANRVGECPDCGSDLDVGSLDSDEGQ